MNRLRSLIKILLFACIQVLVNQYLNGSDTSDVIETTQAFSAGEMELLQKKNTQRAQKLIEDLYLLNSVEIDGPFGKENIHMVAGAQAGYYAKEGTNLSFGPLVIYKRVWVYDSSIALSLAIQNNDSTSDARALWLLKNAQYTRDPENPSEQIFGGWFFSSNQKTFGDSWTDCRFVNGANAYGIKAIAEYITSDYYSKLNNRLKKAYSKLYEDALHGILYHMEANGPNAGLISAGWSLNVLEDFSETNYSYNKLLDMLGYGPITIDGYPGPIKRVKAKNVITEHNNNVLGVLNYTLEHHDRLLGRRSPYTYNKLNEIRLKLRDTIYEKLYDNDERRFITARLPSGEQILYTAIDNVSWLCLSLDLDELTEEQIKKLSDSLHYALINFTRDFQIGEKSYFGAHYFEDGFEDAYIKKSDTHSSSFHIEGTCGLICGLLKFANTFPDDPNAPLFRETAFRLWQDMQIFINDIGFIYASSSLKYISEPLEASASAMWYLLTRNYLEEIIDRYTSL